MRETSRDMKKETLPYHVNDDYVSCLNERARVKDVRRKSGCGCGGCVRYQGGR